MDSENRLTTFRNGKANSVSWFKPSSLRQNAIARPFAPPTPLWKFVGKIWFEKTQFFYLNNPGCSSVSHWREGVPGVEGGDRQGGRQHQRQVLDDALVSDPIHLRLHWPGDITEAIHSLHSFVIKKPVLGKAVGILGSDVFQALNPTYCRLFM